MTQIVFLLYEEAQQSPDSPQRYTISIRFSPGVKHREKFLSDGHLTLGRRPSSHCDHRLGIHGDHEDKSQTPCASSSSCGCHMAGLSQRLGRPASGIEKRTTPFRKMSHPLNLSDLQKDYEEMHVTPVSRTFSRRRLSLSLSALLLPVAPEQHGLRRVKSETIVAVASDVASEEDEDDYSTPQLHSPQLSNSVSSASLQGWLLFYCTCDFFFVCFP